MMMIRRSAQTLLTNRAFRPSTQFNRTSLVQTSSAHQFHTSIYQQARREVQEQVVDDTPKVKKTSKKAIKQIVEEIENDDDDIVDDSEVTPATATKKKKSAKKTTKSEEENVPDNGEKPMTEEDIFNKKNEVYEEVAKLLAKNNVSTATSYLIEWHRFIHTPIKSHPDAAERLYSDHVRQILVDAALLGYYAQCLSSYSDHRSTEALDLFEESFTLLKRFKERKKQAENESGPEAEVTRQYMSSEASQKELEGIEFAQCFTYGFLLIRHNQDEKGEQYLMRACELNDDHTGIFYRLAILNRDKGNYEKAEKYYQRSIDRLENPTLIGDFACFYMKYMKKYDRVPELFEKALEISPKHSENLYNYAVYHHDITKNREKAIELLEIAMHEKAVDPRPASYLGSIQLSMGQFEKARRNFLKAKSMGGFMTYRELSHYALSEVYLGNFEPAKEAFAQALRMHDAEKGMRERRGEQDDSELLGNYGELLFKIYKRYTEAKTMFDRALNADPKNYSALNNYAMLLAKLQELDSAEELFQRSVDIDATSNPEQVKQLKQNLSNYGSFLLNQRNQSQQAGEILKRLNDLVDTSDESDTQYSEQYAKFVAGQG